MRAHSFFFALAAAALFAACTQTPDGPQFTGSLAVDGVKDNAIEISAEEQSFKVTVKADVSWTAESSEDWISIDPASFEITDGKSVTKKATVSVKANPEYESRNAVITFAAEGLDPVQIAVTQLGYEDSFELLDSNLEAVKELAVNVSCRAQEQTFAVKSNVNWTITSPEWLTVSPSSYVADGSIQNTIVKIAFSANEGDALSGNIVVSSEIGEYTVAVSQRSAPKMEASALEVEYPYIDAAFDVTIDNDQDFWTYGLYYKKSLDELGLDALFEDVLSDYNYYLSNNSPDVILNVLGLQGPYTAEYEYLPAATEMVFVAFALEYDSESSAFVIVGDGISYLYATEAAPEADPDYAKYAGTWAVSVMAYDYDSESRKQFNTSMVIDPHYINETYDFYFPDGLFSPVETYQDGSIYQIDSFVGLFDPETKDFFIPNSQLGSAEFYWDFGSIGDEVGIVFKALYGDPNDQSENMDTYVAPKMLQYTLSDDNTLTLVDPVIPSGYQMRWYSLLFTNENDEMTPINYLYNDLYFNNGTLFTRVAESSSFSFNSFEKAERKIESKNAKTLETKSVVPNFFKK
ncbi:MAG: BACON domain-containing protein [Candidatus Cryptobacteroides sp.]